MSVRDRVRSPCVSICALDERELCIGCQRSGDEITFWSQMSDDERRDVLRNVAEREKAATACPETCSTDINK